MENRELRVEEGGGWASGRARNLLTPCPLSSEAEERGWSISRGVPQGGDTLVFGEARWLVIERRIAQESVWRSRGRACLTLG